MNGKTLELQSKYTAQGYTMRATINPDFITSVRRWNKESGQRIAEAIKRGDCKAVLAEMKNTRGRHDAVRDASTHHDKIIYDAAGVASYWWDHKDRKVYELER